MAKWWLVIGSPRNWETAFAHGNLWGFKENQRGLWEHMEKGDRLLFYAGHPVSGVVGFGTLQSRFLQNIPLWPEEVSQNAVLWPLRIEFTPEYCLPGGSWQEGRASTATLAGRARRRQMLQTLEDALARELLQAFPEEATGHILATAEEELPANLHDQTIGHLLEIGRLQNFIAEREYDVDIGKVDVVWRRVARAVPNYVFEVHIGRSLDRDLAKLKHAYDIWNSNIFLVSVPDERERINNLLSGAFHEIKGRLKFIEVARIAELSGKKRGVRELEEELGIL
jgi:predicted RNA-binding protein